MNLLAELEKRELIYQVTDREGLAHRLRERPIRLYIGFDPTADSLHIGNLLQILLLRRFQLAGHQPIAVVGGGTGLIGDPSGKDEERQLNNQTTVETWSAKIRSQLERFLDFDAESNPAMVVNNFAWLGELEVIPFLRDVGKNFSVNVMLAKESVRSRLDKGISFTEFSYMILQAYDFLQLFETEQCELQAGGSDQWGNIVAGVDLIRRQHGKEAFGLTLPLVTTADGKKLGKTAAGSVWLDRSRTSPYDFYQYWINVSDEDVIRLLKYFTFLDWQELAELEEAVESEPWKRVAQRTLAQEVTRMVHGAEELRRAEHISEMIFSGQASQLSPEDLEQASRSMETFVLGDQSEIALVDLLDRADITFSKRRAREDIQNGAISVNDEKISDIDYVVGPDDQLAGQYVLIRRGKKNYHLIRWSS